MPMRHLSADLLRRFLYYPTPTPPMMPPPVWAAGSREVWMKASDGTRLHALWWPQPAGAPVILFFHGNAQNNYAWALVRQDLESLGCRMLLPDYRGYGKSEGRPSEAGLYRDGQAALDWLAAEGVAESEIILFGKSLGGGVACDLVPERAFAGLVLESTFTSLASVSNRLFPFAPADAILPEKYPSAEKLVRKTCPLLVVHGTLDALIPVAEGKALHQLAPEPKELFLVEGAGHNDVSLVAGSDYARHIGTWLRNLRDEG